ncbi:bifunctional 5,10-methylenetetrahydrofolate dehydrogenase/5,10-methenyltetrahydrofolate cyclohydrolase [Levilactobacillus tujiorum]|uniref:Bifunctional protein FolD n=1 Tax=Levilactobacillus tujiorum TaxID=2912243 RepID=A0ABX1L4M1_9LACO|nr:tetrahydrofolate dehydrogenase/cyclohydrolase catalytic domain-containing protein [Levilactobacillus tujiorum]MCH5465039.1 bifunctional methylenetetrahydrofolate dehydrogenase/methenyltetrahydrofolate cyclohydrolase [Levilactobacillus tujiorum]NLR12010.1 bifunctional methylenetetrahydrofolate dehydrogenase/methenyltetrahydrofolate cyclohydrolase [Lactobacillus sp. HBUAS51387]NLR29985.1 bifunctional methylenetetrahydrofolate dehydrogenase/methenyltetrahydrofolate cyclohydrolase [Levilactobacil
MAIIIDGKQIAKDLNTQTQQRVATLAQQGIVPGLAVIIVGDDPASAIYVRNKHRKAVKLGIKSVVRELPATISQAELLEIVQTYNHDDSIHGILVQSPLPVGLDEQAIVAAIDPAKDVDGFHPLNVGRLLANLPGHYPVSCTPRGIMTMLGTLNEHLRGKQAVVVGRSMIVGRPMAAMLLNADMTVTIAHVHTKHLSDLTRTADVLVVATGVTHLIKGNDIKRGAIVIDVGMDRDENGKLTGDVDFDAAVDRAGAITPVPGGVGPMTIATLMQQTVDLCEWSEQLGSN